MVLVDPVMGDKGRAYGIYTEGLREKMIRLVGSAQVITPNLTEALLLLYGKEEMEKKYAELLAVDGEKRLELIGKVGEKLAADYELKAAVITGIEYEKEPSEPSEGDTDGSGNSRIQMGNLIEENGQISWRFAPKTGGSYSGTGDLFASVLSAGLVKGMSMADCVELAVNFLSKAIEEAVQEGTDRNDGVCFEKYLGELCKREK